MQPETKFKNKVQAKLKEIPGIVFFKTQELSIKGVPDIIGCLKGKFFAWELKAFKGAGKAKLQVFMLKRIRAAGGIGHFVYPENFDDCYQELLDL